MRRLMLALSLATAALLAAAPATARTVSGGVVEIGRSVAAIELGMKRADVIEELGRPRMKGLRYMSYGPPRLGVSFDLYLTDGRHRRVRMIGFWGDRFVLADGTKLFRRGAIRTLQREYGRRLRKVEKSWGKLYRLKSRYRGRRVWTDFNVDRFGRRANITSAFILFR